MHTSRVGLSRAIHLWCLLCLLLLLGNCGKSSSTSIYKGTVYSRDTHIPIVGANVELHVAGMRYSSVTDSDGTYIFILPSLEHTGVISITSNGFTAYYSPTAKINTDDSAQILLQQAIDYSQTISNTVVSMNTVVSKTTELKAHLLSEARFDYNTIGIIEESADKTTIPNNELAFMAYQEWKQNFIFIINTKGELLHTIDYLNIDYLNDVYYNNSYLYFRCAINKSCIFDTERKLLIEEIVFDLNIQKTYPIFILSPSKEKILFENLTQTNGFEVSIVDIKKNSVISIDNLNIPSNLSWSPNGQKIMFIKDHSLEPYKIDPITGLEMGLEGYDRSIIVINMSDIGTGLDLPANADDNNTLLRPFRINPQYINVVSATWGSDNETIIFNASDANDSSQRLRIYTFHPTTGTKMIDIDVGEDEELFCPSYSPDMQHIAFIKRKTLYNKNTGNSYILTISILESRNTQPVDIYSYTSEQSQLSCVAWKN
ncbi:peptidase associated/transthyretin-like domain-containing protein [Herpetosiphon geysericola]|uniref:Uncharacterized protein n=1 Tax=Herpetosiphon geysericola TaxID=70996 RepID=A0A0P6Y5M6_9CHLR|nr:hypothetical protein [Herpetosiphon geysericola]KPL80632.1 hypothetical protein SE18_23760 [Herpetosiphon geysericola]